MSRSAFQRPLCSCQAGSIALSGAGKPQCCRHAGPGDTAGGHLQGVSALLAPRAFLIPPANRAGGQLLGGGVGVAPSRPCPAGDSRALLVTRQLPTAADGVCGRLPVPLPRPCPPGAGDTALLPQPRPRAVLPTAARPVAPPALPAGGHRGLEGAGMGRTWPH